MVRLQGLGLPKCDELIWELSSAIEATRAETPLSPALFDDDLGHSRRRDMTNVDQYGENLRYPGRMFRDAEGWDKVWL